MIKHDDEYFMRLAIEEAVKAKSLNEVPIGAVLVREGGEIVSSAYNLSETTFDPTAHAEVIAIRESTKKLGRSRLTGTVLYVTLEPCAMCIGAIVLARIKRLVFGARDPKGGAIVSLYNIGIDKKLNHTVEVQEGLLGNECASLLKDFFKNIRRG